MKVPVDIWQNGFWLKGDQRKKSEKPIPFDGNILPEAVPLGSRRKEGVSYPNQVRFAGEISDVFDVPLAISSVPVREPLTRYLYTAKQISLSKVAWISRRAGSRRHLDARITRP